MIPKYTPSWKAMVKIHWVVWVKKYQCQLFFFFFPPPQTKSVADHHCSRATNKEFYTLSTLMVAYGISPQFFQDAKGAGKEQCGNHMRNIFKCFLQKEKKIHTTSNSLAHNHNERKNWNIDFTLAEAIM